MISIHIPQGASAPNISKEIMSKHEWSENELRFHDVMPAWWWRLEDRDKHYESYVKAQKDRTERCEKERTSQWGAPTIDME